mgnify:CR=1 FL=1
MHLTEITRLASLIVLASFMALLVSAGGKFAQAQNATVTINNYCSETIWVAANPGITSGTITGGSNAGAISTLGGWELDSNATATVTVPGNYSGRFWGRTGCSFDASTNVCDPQTVNVNGNNYVIANCCDTGGCMNGSNFALDCAQTGLPPATLAEFTLASANGGLDNYDVSMVDGGNVAVEIIPSSSDYTCSGNGNCIFTGNLPGTNSPNCTQDSDCYQLFGFGYKWKCDPTLNECVNPFFCGSPGCTDTAGCAPSGLVQSDLPSSPWTGSSGLAVSQANCPSELILNNDQNQGTTYAGCFAPQKFCRQACTSDGQCGPPYTFNCGASGFCEQSKADPVILGADCDTAIDNTTNGNLWACTGVNAGSCFTTGTTDASCCGCPTWAPGYPNGAPNGACVAGNNSDWQSVAQPISAIFNTSSPTSYAFPYDDAIKLFSCQNSGNQAVNYTVNFCPNDTDGDGVQNSGDADTDNDGVADGTESGNAAVTANAEGDLVGTPDDADADGIPNRRDLDSDNDGLTDHYECGGTDDADADGEVDSDVDANQNGLADEYDPAEGGDMLECADTDGDGIRDFLDINSDNQDGTDYEENGGTDTDADGLPDSTEDSNADGLLDIFDPERGGAPLVIRDSDDDGIPDQLDPESSGKNGGSCAIAPANKAASGWTGLIYLAIPALVILRRKLRRMEK